MWLWRFASHLVVNCNSAEVLNMYPGTNLVLIRQTIINKLQDVAKHQRLIDRLSMVLRLRQHNISYTADGNTSASEWMSAAKQYQYLFFHIFSFLLVIVYPKCYFIRKTENQTYEHIDDINSTAGEMEVKWALQVTWAPIMCQYSPCILCCSVNKHRGRFYVVRLIWSNTTSKITRYVEKICQFFVLHFYRAMHFSAKRGIAIACRLSVCL